MPMLFSWAVRPHGCEFLAWGIVSGHRKLLEGTYIHTSPICRAALARDRVVLETASGNVYPLLLEELNVPPGRPELSLPPPAELGLPSDLWERCIKAHEQAQEKEKQALRALGIPRVLRLRFVGTSALSALWCGQDGAVRPIPIGVHSGMFQDSVLIGGPFAEGLESCRVDFRYFPMEDQVEPYRICDEIETILIVNEGVQDVVFRRGAGGILCPAGETTPIAVKK